MQLHFAGDILIWLAYFAIPLVLVAFVWPRKRLLLLRPYVLCLFAAFILSCGLSHLMEAITFSYPAYRASALIKIVTAVISWITVFALVPTVRGMSDATERTGLSGEIAIATPAILPESADRPYPYLVAVLSVAVATGLRFALLPILGYEAWPLLLYFLATKISAWYGGFGPCLAAVFMSCFIAWYLFLGEPYSFFGLGVPEITGLALFLGIGIFTGLMSESLLSSRRLVEAANAELLARTKDLEDLNLELEQRVTERTKSLAASNAELEQFAYVASHDLQEPLRMVASFCQLLEERYKDKLDARGQEFIHYAVDGARRMQLLVNDLLAYARVTSKARPSLRLSAAEPLAQAVESLKFAIKDAKAGISVGPLPEVWADPLQLAQLFQNLLGNAVKFHRKGVPPEIHVSSTPDEDGFCRFAIKDNGIGIDPKHQDKLFVIFQRLHRREEYEGTGIGLALCKKIVERHGGRIWLESEEGVGTTFFFTLPCGRLADVLEQRGQDPPGGGQPG